ncbi:MAG TPA: hypothetical protein VKP78_04740 [bacterium]|nr:hypothetical protein [bacterium]
MSGFNIYFENFETGHLALLAAAILFVYFFVYKQYKNRSRLLIFTRTAIFIVLILIILKPVISWQSKQTLKSEFLFFIDNSLSFAEQENYDQELIHNNIENLDKILQDKGLKTAYFSFAGELNPIGALNQLDNQGQNTNLANIFTYLQSQKNRNFRGALIISDGVATQGRIPTSFDNYGTGPVFTSGLGDTTAQKDASLLDVEMETAAQVGDTVNISTEINPASRSSQIQLSLKVDGQTIDTKQIKGASSYQRTALDFLYIPDKTGSRNIELVIEDDQDKNLFNNQLQRQLKVNKKYENYIIVGGQYNFDGKLFNRIFASRENTATHQLVAHKGNWLPENQAQKILDMEWDLVVFNSFPTPKINPELTQTIQNKLKSQKCPLIVRVDQHTDIEQLGKIIGTEPFQQITQSKQIKEVSPTINQKWKNHPVNLFLENSMTEEWWRNLPPIEYPFNKVTPDREFVSLFQTMDVNQNSILALFRADTDDLPGIALLNGAPFWKWQMMTIGPDVEGFYENMLLAVSQYLTDTTGRSPIQIFPDSKKYNLGEKIRLSGNIRDVRGQPLKNASVRARILKNGQEAKSFVIPRTDQQYTTDFFLSQPGDYSIALSAEQTGEKFAEVERKISVIDRPVELEELVFKKDVLENISRKTEAKFFTPQNIDRIADQVKVRDEKITRNHKIKLWQWKYMLIILLTIFLIDLVFRKLRGYL